ncbi:MAG TPA: elongation factor G [Acidobacteriota bacterium]|nr:elongation factor G [Acidobacteriota bacterium]
MKVFESERIRNLSVVGHGDAGKTTLVSALLYTSGAVNRLGKVEDGTTITDYDDDEVDRKITINTALAHCEWKSTKINLLDTPGYRAFILDAKSSMTAAEAALLVVDSVSGVEVQTEVVWDFAAEYEVPRFIIINKLDRDNGSFARALESCQKAFGREVVPIQIPLGKESDFKGVVDLIKNKAFVYAWDGKGNAKEEEVPATLKDEVETRREELIEMIAESDDQLMEKFFENGTLSEAEMQKGLSKSIRDGRIHPVLCTSASHNVGVRSLLDTIVSLSPSPVDRRPVKAVKAGSEDAAEVKIEQKGATSAFVFKTLADQFAGRITLLKVYSGNLKSDSVLHNLNKDKDERLGTLQVFQGKSHEAIPEVAAGDICGVLKLKETKTGDTLADRGFSFMFPEVSYPEPAISFAVEPASRGDEEKIGSAVSKIMEEDPSLRFDRDQQTNEFLLSGSGQLHIEVSVGKLKKRFGVDVLLKTPKVPYRETITASADVQGRHKKQTGGHGQFGDCKIKMEPLTHNEGFEFENKIFGGAIPRTYIPAVEKGIVEAASKGFLAGFPVVNFKVVLYDGSYHDVDSSEMAFKIAGAIAFKKAMEKARPVLLEPIMDVEVYVPEENAGDIMGDLNGRRGRIQGMDIKGSTQVIRAQVPMAEMLNYQPTLTSMTGDRGSYHMQQSHYDVVPHNLAEKVIEQAKKEAEEAHK